MQQALRDLSAWVAKGIEPAQSTEYEVVDGQMVAPPTAAARKGIQPVVALEANGAKRAEVANGRAVRFAGTIEAPPKVAMIHRCGVGL